MRFNLLPMEIQLYILSFLDDEVLVFLKRVHPYLDRLIGNLMTPLGHGYWMWKPAFKDWKVQVLACGSRRSRIGRIKDLEWT
ncbi:hypothetical protein GJ744_001170 [Endocarpon pusillum]|uniref:F-box domain-containing protein n=1 Tax=Endocarpon pusillum TaxID=364733 RepID=A0A8H7E1D4_9EURO|nr:hypothetical protein GJ744_001170 [Endocarpon pusillum]